MQQLDVISINIWQILIALINLIILFLVLKRFLYKPVEKMLKKREDEINKQYENANSALEAAEVTKTEYETRLNGAKIQAENIIENATNAADKRSKKIVSDACEEADAIVKRAKAQAERERVRAESEIKDEIVGVSSLLAEKLLSREINADDHKKLIDSFINELGEANDINE